MAEELYKADFRKRVARLIVSRISETLFMKPSFEKEEKWEQIIIEELMKENERQ